MKKLSKYLKSFFRLVVFGIALTILIYSSSQLYRYNKERVQNEKLAEEVVSESVLQQAAPIHVDFETLKQKNDDIIAWLYCEGTPINYPVVQAADNAYYLHRGTDGEYRSSGTLFLDCQNNDDFSDNNSIIYGHNMKNDTMFGVLTEYVNQAYYDAHSEMYLLTPEKDYKVKLVAGVTESSTASIYNLPLEENYKETFITAIRRKSTFESEYVFSPDDRFVMLSTCSYAFDDARYVLVGFLSEI